MPRLKDASIHIPPYMEASTDGDVSLGLMNESLSFVYSVSLSGHRKYDESCFQCLYWWSRGVKYPSTSPYSIGYMNVPNWCSVFGSDKTN